MALKFIPANPKNEVLALIAKVNAEKGRGGVAAAAKKFKISAVTIGRWLNPEVAGKAKAAKPSVKKETVKKSAAKKAEKPAKKAAEPKRVTAEVFIKATKKVRVLEKQQEALEQEIQSLLQVMDKYLG